MKYHKMQRSKFSLPITATNTTSQYIYIYTQYIDKLQYIMQYNKERNQKWNWGIERSDNAEIKMTKKAVGTVETNGRGEREDTKRNERKRSGSH